MCLTVTKYKDRTEQSKIVNFFPFYKYNPGSTGISKLQSGGGCAEARSESPKNTSLFGKVSPICIFFF